jgi:hypothetical protein
MPQQDKCADRRSHAFDRQGEVTMRILAMSAALALAGCDGPRENAGEQADFAAGAVNSEDTLRSGPAEQLGEIEDRADQARERATDAQADALEAAADEKREAADQAADALENQANAVRSQ